MKSSHPPVRDTDPYTSWAAARINTQYRMTVKGLIFSALSNFGPMTHDQLIEAVNKVQPASESGVRTRTAELVEDGMVERHPSMVAKSRYGRASLLWRVVDPPKPRCRTCGSHRDIEYGYCVSCDPGDGQTGE